MKEENVGDNTIDGITDEVDEGDGNKVGVGDTVLEEEVGDTLFEEEVGDALSADGEGETPTTRVVVVTGLAVDVDDVATGEGSAETEDVDAEVTEALFIDDSIPFNANGKCVVFRMRSVVAAMSNKSSI